jgi:PAS domain S-box-containing protein/putative nucleotidyltransferase with HDIG domain
MDDKFYKKIVENSQIGYAYHKIICDDDGVPSDYEFIEVNRAFEKLTGLKGSDIIGKLVSDVLPGIKIDKFDWIKFYGYIAINGGDEEFEQFSVPLNRWYKGRVYSPKKNYFITLFDDALMQRKVLEELLSDKKYFEMIFDANPDAILTIRLNDGVIININAAFAKQLGYSRDELIGKNCNEANLCVNPIHYNKITIELAEKSSFDNNEITFRRKDGSIFTGLVSGKTVAMSTDLYGFYNIHNIEERKRAEEALIASESRYRRLFESAKDGILIIDAETGKIINVNPFLLDLLSYSEEQILGKSIWEIGTFKDIIANQDNFLELQQKEYIRYENLPLQTADGRKVAVEFVSNVYLEGQHKVIQCNIRDITDRIQSELFQNLSGEVLAILNEPGDLHDLIQRILSIMKLKTGSDAVGMRLQSGDDFPYYAQHGFSEDFLRVENSLMTSKPGGDICRNSDGSISLECTCGLVISGKTDPSNPLFTPGGSFWMNDSFPLPDLPADNDPRLHPRSRCIHQGYASVALVPIRKNQQIVGLLQLNNRSRDKFNRDVIKTLEEIASHIGEALVRKQMEEMLRESEQKLSSILHNITDVIWSLSLPDMSLFYVSPSVEKMYGRSAEEFAKNPSLWQEAVHPDDQHLTEKAFAQLYEEGAAARECRIVRPDGSIVWIYDRSQLVYDEKQVPVRIEGLASDITERKQAEGLLKKRLAELEAIYTVSATLRTAGTLDEMLTLLLGEILKVLDTTAGAICLYQPANRKLRFTTTQGWFSGLDDAFLKPGDSIAGIVFTSKKVLVSREYAKDSRMKYTEKIPEGWGGVCLPLQADADVVGTLFVSVPLPREITSEELKLLTSLTEMAGTAIHRIGLFEKNIRHMEQLQALRNIDLAISGSLDLRVTFRVILDEVTRLLNVDAAAILRLNPHTGMLKYEAWRGFRITNPAKLNLCIGEGLAGRAVMERKSIRVASPSEIEGDPVQGPLMEKENAHSYYAVPLINKGRVEGVLEIFHREPLDANEEWLEFLETLAGQTAIAIDNAELVHNMANTNFKLIQAYDNTIKGWAHALDLRDKETEDHSQRVTEMTVNIAREMGMSQEELAHVRRGALLHDIGKMGVSDAILLKPGQLADEEWAIMHKHPIHAFEMLSPIEYLRPALDIPYCHHEKWDGTGYPRGLKRKEIPLAARIFAVVDVYDALTSDRPYRKAWTREEALEYIRQESGRHFDPQAVEMFFKEVK